MLLAVCQVLDEATRSLAGNPPQGTVCDAAPCNSMVIRAFVGQLPASIMEQHDFLKQCTVEVPKLKFWPFGFVKHGEAQNLMTSFLGGFHIQKRFGLQFQSGARKVVLGQVYVELSGMLGAGLPPAAYCVREPQSDKHSACRMAPCYIGRNWLCLGTHVYALLGGLISACTCASTAFSKRELVFNALSLHYWCVLHAACNRHRFGKAWQCYSISITTLRNISRMAAGAVATSLTNLEPAALQELRVEQHFGLIKKHAQGSPTLKDLIMGTAKEHARQACILRSMTAEELPTAFTTQARDAISEGELPRLGQEALGCAIQLQCFISKDLTPSDCYFFLLDFWQRHGSAKLFGQCDSGADAAEACQEAEVEEDILPGDVEVLPADAAESSQDAAKRNDNGLSTITSVQARAAVTEQVEHALAVLADPERQIEATDDEPANLDVPRFDLKALEDMMMAEVAESGDADEQREQGAETPKTLLQLLRQVLRQGGAEFNIGEASSAGTHACLKRIHSMIGPIKALHQIGPVAGRACISCKVGAMPGPSE